MINSFFVQKYINKNQLLEDYSRGWQSSVRALEEVKKENRLNYHKLFSFSKPQPNKRK